MNFLGETPVMRAHQRLLQEGEHTIICYGCGDTNPTLNKEPMDFNLPASLSNNFFDDIIVIHMSHMAYKLSFEFTKWWCIYWHLLDMCLFEMCA